MYDRLQYEPYPQDKKYAYAITIQLSKQSDEQNTEANDISIKNQQ